MNKSRRVITEKWHKLVSEKNPFSTGRMVTAINNNKLSTLSSGPILIDDGACDQTLITKYWYILSHTGI